MKQKFLSVFLALALTASLLPTAAFAEDAHEPSSTPVQSIEADNPENPDNPNEPDTPPADSIDLAAEAVQALIDALPTVDTVTAADYDAVQDAYDAYDALNEEQQAQIIGAEVFEALFAWFNGQTAPIADAITYIGANGNVTETNYTMLTADTTVSSGTYLVNSSFTVEDGLSFNGNTMLILGDGAMLTVNGVLSCTGDLTITTVENAKNAKLTVNGGIRAGFDRIDNGYGIYTAGSFTVYGGEVTAIGGNDYDDSFGIFTEGALKVSGGKVEAKGGKADANSYGIYTRSTLTVEGTGKLTATGGTREEEGVTVTRYSYGIHAAKASTVSGGEVTATSGKAISYSHGIYANGRLTVSGGRLEAKGGTDAKYSDGIYANEGLTVSGGTVTATGSAANSESCGIWAKSVSIADATVTAYSDGSTPKSCGIFAGSVSSTVASGNNISISQAAGKTTMLYGKDNGPVSLSAYTITYNGGMLTLATDSTFAYSLSGSGDLASLLPEGYAFARRTADGKAEDEILPGVENVESGTIVLKRCDHMDEDTSARENGLCKFCGGVGTLAKNSTSGIEYENFALAYTAANNGETIALLSDVYDALTINDSSKKITLDLNGYNATGAITVSVPATITDSAGGGTITTLTTGGDVKIGGLLAEGYGFRSSSAWYDSSSEATSIGNVSVKELPIKSVSISTTDNKTNFAYGEDVALTAAVTLAAGYDESDVTYAWENAGGNGENLGSMKTITRENLAPKNYNIKCTVAVGDYSLSDYIEFTVNKATLTGKYTAPTAKIDLTYTGSDQELINAGSFNSGISGPKFQYGMERNGVVEWGDTVENGRNAGAYTVYWYIKGGTNYESVGSEAQPAGSVEVTIAKPDSLAEYFTFTAPTALVYDGAAKTAEVVSTKPGTGSVTVKYFKNGTEAVQAKDAGVYTVKIDVAEGDNYSAATDLTADGWTFTITKAAARTLNDIEISQKFSSTAEQSKQIGRAGMPEDAGTLSYTTGEPSVTGTADIDAFTVDTEGLVKYRITGGMVGAVITLPVTISSVNYADSTVNVVVMLTEKAEQAALTISSDTEVTYGQTLTLSTSGGSGKGAVRYEVVSGAALLEENRLTPTKAGTVKIKAIKAADADYNEAESDTVTITVHKAAPAGTPGYTAITESGKKLSDAALTIGSITPDGGTIAWESGDDTVVAANTAYRWIYTPAAGDQDNYTTLTGSITPYRVSSGGSSGGSSSGGSSASSSTTITVPVASESSSVDVKAEVSKEGTATVEISDKQIESVAKNGSGTVTVDVSGLKNVESVQVPTHVVETTNKAKDTGLTVALPAGTVALDETALESISGGSDVTIAVQNIPTNRLNEAQKEAIGSRAEVAVVVDVDLFVGKEKQSTFNGGKLTISVPYTPKKGEDTSKLTIWFIKDDGTIENMGGYYDAEKGCFVFETEHLSRYLLVSVNESPADTREDITDVRENFVDVPADAYYADAVAWAVENGITSGIGENRFAPNETCTRAQIVAFLWRAAGKPTTDSAQNFADVDAGSYYSKAIRWAVSEGITSGTSADTFSPDDTVTRGQTVTFLWRAAGKPDASGSLFADVNENEYYAKAVAWAVAEGITSGTGGNTFSPKAACTRGEIVTFLYRTQK